MDAVAAFGELRSLIHVAKSIDQSLHAALYHAREAGVPVTVLAKELGVNRATLYRQFDSNAVAS